MGLLDDAIREHLELKRRRGADPNEIERLEQEALGPVRRGPRETYEGQLPDEPEPAYRDEDAVGAYAESDEPPFMDDGTELMEIDEVEEWEPQRRGPIQGGIPVEPDTAAPATPAPPLPGEGPPVPAQAPPPAGALDEHDYLEQETVEHEVEADGADATPEDAAGEDDMLEETPEFLQDTPDHDRLWFEQRPPRDFDLDG